MCHCRRRSIRHPHWKVLVSTLSQNGRHFPTRRKVQTCKLQKKKRQRGRVQKYNHHLFPDYLPPEKSDKYLLKHNASETEQTDRDALQRSSLKVGLQLTMTFISDLIFRLFSRLVVCWGLQKDESKRPISRFSGTRLFRDCGSQHKTKDETKVHAGVPFLLYPPPTKQACGVPRPIVHNKETSASSY